MKNPEISIIVVTYGRYQYLKDLVESVRSSTPPNAYEFVIVSSDSPKSEKVEWLLQQKDVNLILADTRKEWQLRKNTAGYYGNLGVKNCTKEWVLVVNDDMRFDKDWYKEFVGLVSNPKDSDVGNVVILTHLGKYKYGRRIEKIGKIKKGQEEWKDLYLSDYSIISKDTIREAGLFDEKINWYGPGADISLAIEFLTNKKTVASEKVILDHFVTKEGRRDNLEDEFTDFHYVLTKWNGWCKKNNCQHTWNPKIKPYTLYNRTINYMKREARILKHYGRCLIKTLETVK